MKKSVTLINNGLPEGVDLQDIQNGTVLLIRGADSVEEKVMVIDRGPYRKNHKGLVSFEIIDSTGTRSGLQADQVVGMLLNIRPLNLLLSA